MLLNSTLLKNNKQIALAVSGGPDSLAMLYLMHEQAKGKKLIALTVDHKLRSESKEEAKYVALICKNLGIEHHILEWKHSGVKGNIHDQARKARYGLMTDFCLANEIDALCTAHHADDRIENFFMRIYQGAGIFGLIDKDHIIYNGINIIRPLFHAKKAELIEYLEKSEIKYIEDPSNKDPKYLRSNIRKWLSMIPEELDSELFRQRIISVKHNLERASEVIDRIYNEELEKIEIFEEGYVIISSLPQDREIAYMLLSKVLNIIGDSGDLIRLESIERLYESRKKKTTLGGCFIYRYPNDESFLIAREFGKNPPKDTMLKNGAIWDNRYLVRRNKTHKDLRISYLNQKEYSEIKKYLKYPQKLEKHLQRNKEIIFTLPVIKNLEKVIAIPHINYYDDAYSNLKNEITIEFIRNK